MEVTREFSIKHATVTYPDGSTENVEYAEMEDHGGETVRLFHATPETWRTYLTADDEPRLRRTRHTRHKTTLSTYNFEKVEVDWQEELVAVAEVSIESETISKGLFGWRSYEDKSVSLDGDVTFYERAEWEAMQ